MNISSIIIHSDNPTQCKENLSKIQGVEVALMEGNTIIATIEAEDTSGEVRILGEIERTSGVLSAAMHYTYFEDNLKDEISKMTDSARDSLNDDSVPIEEIRYTGSVDYMMKNNKK